MMKTIFLNPQSGCSRVAHCKERSDAAVGMRGKKILPRSGQRKIYITKKIKRRPLRGGKNMGHLYTHSCGEDALQWATLLHPLRGFKNVRIMLAKLEKRTPDSYGSESRMTNRLEVIANR